MTLLAGPKALFTKVDTVIVRVQRLEDAQRWYEEKLGFRIGYCDEKERLVVFDLGAETSLTIYEWKPDQQRPGGDAQSSYPIFYPRDIDAVHRHLADHGVKVGSIDADGRGTRWFTFWDLDSNRLEVCHYPVTQAGPAFQST